MPTVKPAAIYADPATLIPWANNPRDNQRAIDKVAASIERFGFGAPIVARKADKEVIAGHTRLAAALQLGLDAVPVRFLDVNAHTAHMMALADNKLGEVAMWDEGLLRNVLSDLDEVAPVRDMGLGWNNEELDAMLTGAVFDVDVGGDHEDGFASGSQFGLATGVAYTLKGPAAAADDADLKTELTDIAERFGMLIKMTVLT